MLLNKVNQQHHLQPLTSEAPSTGEEEAALPPGSEDETPADDGATPLVAPQTGDDETPADDENSSR